MKKHDFFQFMGSIKESLASDYRRIRQRSKEDPGTAGDQAEEDWAAVLRNWLPAQYPVVTKGRLLFEDGQSSPQVDVLVLRPSYPIALRDKKFFFAGGVVAAFECKLTLRKPDIDEAFATAAKIKRKVSPRSGTPYGELNVLPIYGVLAHSHEVKRGRASWKLHKYVEEAQAHAQHPSELLDMLCVADAVAMPVGKHVVLGPDLDDHEKEELRGQDVPGVIATMYTICDEDKEPKSYDDTGAILASFINDLTRRIAFTDSSIQTWADHVGSLGIYGGIGRPIYWPVDILSAQVRERLQNMGRDPDQWSPWTKHLP